MTDRRGPAGSAQDRAEALRTAERHLVRQDPAFRSVVSARGPCTLGERGRHDRTAFSSLVTSVVSQQLSTRAAATISDRLIRRAGGRLTAESVGALSIADLRETGLSNAKARTVQGIADAVRTRSLDLAGLRRQPDDSAVVASLTSLWGVGEWTAHMFCIFTLGRLDIWPVGDLGVRKGWQQIHDHAATPAADDLIDPGTPLSPYRSVAAWYCWRALDPD